MREKIHIDPEGAVAPGECPLCDWSVSMFRFNRMQYIIAANSTSLLPVFFYGRGITDGKALIQAFRTALKERHEQLGLEYSFDCFIQPSFKKVTWSKLVDRSLIGSVNEFVRSAKGILTYQNVCPAELSVRMGNLPMGDLNNESPLEKHRKLYTIHPA